MSQCGRCVGRGRVKNFYHDGSYDWFRCAVCLGLGSFETNPKYKRPLMHHHSAVLHSDVDIKDAIALLPEGEPSDDEEE